MTIRDGEGRTDGLCPRAVFRDQKTTARSLWLRGDEAKDEEKNQPRGAPKTRTAESGETPREK